MQNQGQINIFCFVLLKYIQGKHRYLENIAHLKAKAVPMELGDKGSFPGYDTLQLGDLETFIYGSVLLPWKPVKNLS